MEINISDYHYSLPDHRIARYPLAERDQSKLLVYRDNQITHSHFKDLISFLPEGCTLFFNDTKVIPARLHFLKDSGAAIEVFLLHPVLPSAVVALAMAAKGKCQWQCTIGNAKRWKENQLLQYEQTGLNLTACLKDRAKGIVEFQWSSSLTFSEMLQQAGHTPLPPYLHREAEASDKERYQTVYSKNDGAVAAPTAGLHFTPKIFSALEAKGITTDYVTLHVSAGTFQPVKVENAFNHHMHSEQLIVTQENIRNLLNSKKIVAVGTTSLRTIESLYWYGAKLIHNSQAEFLIDQNDPYQVKPVDTAEALRAIDLKMKTENTNQLRGETSIYIYPGYDFKIADALITNFHQPGSTLMLLVAAFVGNSWKNIYHEALENSYRFLSYGDSSLLFRSHT
ncbi:MAG: S-adenosylmethionine:tRNA ribosyltransferase-isomerase [Bacteroidetes bacterium]|nr:S-adenosylmethionine:tRNA ribosyltransferase-isomerase [Bacteroidota bacterium]MBS1539505.1 S-adenosylmethionine:tRNA ribosyltransferase-isomerase [Bacteroidota bacterium]